MMPEAAPVVGSYVSRRLSRPVCAAFHADEVSTMRGTMARNCVRKCSSWSPAVRLATLALVMLLFTSLPLIESLESSSTRIKKRRHRQTGGDTSILCRATPIMQRENAFARYQTMQPSSNIEEFLEEWRADIPAKDRARFVPMRVLGRGFQGSVVAAKDVTTRKVVAIKQVKDAFGTFTINGLRTLRELTLLRIMNSSDYTVDILHAFLPKKRDEGWNNVYFVMEMLDMSLSGEDEDFAHFRALSASKQTIMIYDVLTALAEMHGAGIHHRDITAKNIMAYTDCRFKLIDFGMSAPAESLTTKEAIPDEYPKRGIGFRPPELLPFLQTPGQWKTSTDIWVTGCALLQMILGFKANVCVTKTATSNTAPDMKVFQGIIRVLGMPSESTLSKYSPRGRMFFKQNRPVPWSPPAGLVAEYPDANRALLKFVQRMMDLDPDNRPSAAELLQDPIFWKVQQLTKRKTPNFAKKLPIVRKHKELMIREGFGSDDYRLMVYNEVLNHYRHPSTQALHDVTTS